MRMWMVDPKLLCRKHLLGEHGEIHKHKHNFIKQHNISGRAGQIEPSAMERRHDILATEMIRRGYKHDSPYTMPDISYLPIRLQTMKVDTEYSLNDLSNRCKDCNERIRDD